MTREAYDYRVARIALQRLIQGQIEQILASHSLDIHAAHVAAAVDALVAREMRRHED